MIGIVAREMAVRHEDCMSLPLRLQPHSVGRAGSRLARSFGAGRCCVVRAFALQCDPRKAVPAPLSVPGTIALERSGTTPPVVVPLKGNCAWYRRCREPST